MRAERERLRCEEEEEEELPLELLVASERTGEGARLYSSLSVMNMPLRES